MQAKESKGKPDKAACSAKQSEQPEKSSLKTRGAKAAAEAAAKAEASPGKDSSKASSTPKQTEGRDSSSGKKEAPAAATAKQSEQPEKSSPNTRAAKAAAEAAAKAEASAGKDSSKASSTPKQSSQSKSTSATSSEANEKPLPQGCERKGQKANEAKELPISKRKGCQEEAQGSEPQQVAKRLRSKQPEAPTPASSMRSSPPMTPWSRIRTTDSLCSSREEENQLIPRDLFAAKASSYVAWLHLCQHLILSNPCSCITLEPCIPGSDGCSSFYVEAPFPQADGRATAGA